MVQVINKECSKLKVGDEIWYINAWGTLCHGIISEIKETVTVTKEGKFGGISAGARLDRCWPSKTACCEAEKRRQQLQIEEYKKEIMSVNDLVKFLYTKIINDCENPDDEACEAAKARAKDFGIELED